MRIFYHRTTPEAAQSILTDGFKDGTGKYLTDEYWTGVWLSDAPLDPDHPRLSEVLRITFEVDDIDFDLYEWPEEHKSYREWLIPAAIVNRGRIEVIDESEMWD